MIYSVIAVILSVFLIFLTVLGEKNPQFRRNLITINVILSLVGCTASAFIYFIVKGSVFSGEYDETWSEWAWDMFTLFYSISLPVLGVLLGILIVSTVLSIFTERKKSCTSQKVRVMAASASSIVMLIIAPVYGFMTQNDVIPLYGYILVSGIAQALVFRIVFAIEYYSISRNNVKRM